MKNYLSFENDIKNLESELDSYCNDILASNYNPNSNFNDGSCIYPFDPLYTFSVNIENVNYPPVKEMKLKITNFTTGEDKIYDMHKFGNNYNLLIK